MITQNWKKKVTTNVLVFFGEDCVECVIKEMLGKKICMKIFFQNVREINPGTSPEYCVKKNCWLCEKQFPKQVGVEKHPFQFVITILLKQSLRIFAI